MARDLDLAQLERLTYPDTSERQDVSLTPERLGKIIALVWQSDQPEGDIPFPGKRELCQLLLSRGDVPSLIQSALRVEYRPDGPAINYTALINGAQQAGIVQRVNPGHVRASVGVTPAEARVILQRYINRFPEEITWIRTVLKEHKASLQEDRTVETAT